MHTAKTDGSTGLERGHSPAASPLGKRATPTQPREAADQSSLSIVVADANRMVAEGMAALLSREHDLEVVDIGPPDTLLETVERLDPGVVLLDIPVDGKRSLALVRELRARRPTTRVLAVTTRTDSGTVTRAVDAGVWGFVPKRVAGSELVDAVRTVGAGKAFLHPEVTHAFLQRTATEEGGPQTLSRRECEVLEQFAAGLSTRQVAEALGVGEETVKSHLSRIYRKLDANDRVHAVVIAFRHGLIS